MTEEVQNLMEERKEAKMKPNKAMYRTMRRDTEKTFKEVKV